MFEIHKILIVVLLVLVGVFFVLDLNGVYFSPYLEEGGSISGLIYGPVDFLVKAEQYLGGGSVLQGDDGDIILACGESICETFESEPSNVKNPFEKKPLWWKRFYEGLERDIEDLGSQASAWAGRVKCESDDCIKVERTEKDLSLNFVPTDVSDSDECFERIEEYVASGFAQKERDRWCVGAASEALKDLQSKLRQEIKDFCGEGCAGGVSISDAHIERSPYNDGKGCSVLMTATVEIKCTGQKLDSDNGDASYDISVLLRHCVNCLPNGNVKHES